MKKEIKEVSQVKRIFEIFVKKEDVDKIKDEVLNDLKKNLMVPGFRKGKAPKPLIFNKYKKLVKDEVVKKILNDAGDIEKEIKEKGLEILGDLKLKELNFEFGSDFKAELEFEIMPQFEIKDIDGEEIKVSPKKEITEKDVEEVIEKLREQHAIFKPSEDEASKEGDIIDVSFLFEEKSENTAIQLFPYSQNPKEELSELQKELLNLKKGDEKEITVKAKELKRFMLQSVSDLNDEFEIKVKIKVESIKKRTIPELNDDFAKEYFNKESLEELKNDIKKDLETREKNLYENEIRNKIMEKLRETNEFEIPSILLDNITKNKAYSSAKQIFGSVPQNIANAISDMTFSTLEEGDSKEDIKNEAKNYILINKYIEQNKIEVTDDDFKKKIEEISKIYNVPSEDVERELIKDENAMLSVKEEIKRDKAFDILKEKVKIVIEENKEEKKEENKEKEE